MNSSGLRRVTSTRFACVKSLLVQECACYTVPQSVSQFTSFCQFTSFALSGSLASRICDVLQICDQSLNARMHADRPGTPVRAV